MVQTTMSERQVQQQQQLRETSLSVGKDDPVVNLDGSSLKACPLSTSVDDTFSSSSSLSSLSSKGSSYLAKPAPTTRLVSALKTPQQQGGQRRRWKRWGKKKHRVHFGTSTTIGETIPQQDQNITWYNRREIESFQHQVDQLQTQLADDPSASFWVRLHEQVFQQHHQAHAKQVQKGGGSVIAGSVREHVDDAFLVWRGMEAMATDDVMHDRKSRRVQHVRAVLDVQATCPYNNAHRRHQALQQVSLSTSEPAQQWAQRIAQFAWEV